MRLVGFDASNSFSQETLELLNELGNALKRRRDKLQTVIIANNQEHNLGPYMIPLIKCWASFPQLKELVISGNQIGDDGIKIINGLVRTSQTIERLCFNKCGMTQITLFTELLDFCLSTERKILIEWPATDIVAMRQKRSYTSSGSRTLRSPKP
jgi:hypothetical protein